MDMTPPTPEKPGWYWDPWELAYNVELRERWRRQVLLLQQECYRLRRWDGLTWTGDTLDNYTMHGLTAIPYTIGPTTRIYPLTPEQSKRNLKIWAVLMVLSAVFALVMTLAK